MEIYERIRQLRKDELGLSRDAFGEKLGVNRDVINNIERNRLARPEQKEPLYRLICKTFNVSYEWLTTGEGEMWDFSTDDFIEKLALKHKLDDLDKEILRMYIKTPLFYRSNCRDAIKLLIEGNHVTYLSDLKKPQSQRLDYGTDSNPAIVKLSDGKKVKVNINDTEAANEISDLAEADAKAYIKNNSKVKPVD